MANRRSMHDYVEYTGYQDPIWLSLCISAHPPSSTSHSRSPCPLPYPRTTIPARPPSPRAFVPAHPLSSQTCRPRDPARRPSTRRHSPRHPRSLAVPVRRHIRAPPSTRAVDTRQRFRSPAVRARSPQRDDSPHARSTAVTLLPFSLPTPSSSQSLTSFQSLRNFPDPS